MDLAGAADLASSGVGYAGAAMIALGYMLNQGGRLRSDDWRFPALNLLGSGLVMVSLAVHPNLPSIAIEAFWSAISVYGIQRNLRTGRGRRI